VGKVVSYTLTWTESGDRDMSVEIACAPGLGEADDAVLELAPNGLRLTPAMGHVDVLIENTAETQLVKWNQVRPPMPAKVQNEEEVEPPLFTTETVEVETEEPGKIDPTKITFEPIVPRNEFEGSCTLLQTGPFGLPTGITI
jgi:hypothetical protein